MKGVLCGIGLTMVVAIPWVSCSGESENDQKGSGGPVSVIVFERRFEAPMEKCWAATEAALTESGYDIEIRGYSTLTEDGRVVERESGDVGAKRDDQIVSKALARRTDSSPIEVEVEPVDPNTTEVKFKLSRDASEVPEGDFDFSDTQISPIIKAILAKLK